MRSWARGLIEEEKEDEEEEEEASLKVRLLRLWVGSLWRSLTRSSMMEARRSW